MDKTSIIYLLTTFTTRYRDNLDKLMKEIGLHGGQIFVLNWLWEHDGSNQAEIVKSLKLTAPTVYNMVIRLAETGFVEIKKDEFDARMSRIFLTKRGIDIQAEVVIQWSKFERQTFTNLTETEKMMFSMLLQKLIEESN